MSSAEWSGLELRSRVAPEGELVLSLEERTVGEPGSKYLIDPSR